MLLLVTLVVRVESLVFSTVVVLLLVVLTEASYYLDLECQRSAYQHDTAVWSWVWVPDTRREICTPRVSSLKWTVILAIRVISTHNPTTFMNYTAEATSISLTQPAQVRSVARRHHYRSFQIIVAGLRTTHAFF